jgi:hypothetical protein
MSDASGLTYERRWGSLLFDSLGLHVPERATLVPRLERPLPWAQPTRQRGRIVLAHPTSR